MTNLRKTITIFSVSAALLFTAVGAFADTDSAAHDINLAVSEIAVLGLNDTGSISLSTASTVEPGADPSLASADTDSSKYLKYTSVVNNGATRSISVALGSTGVPSGTQLTVVAADAGTPQDGDPAASPITLAGSMTPAVLISGIGSSATGTGASDGAQLTYSFSITDVTLLEEDADTTVTVTYTLSDDA